VDMVANLAALICGRSNDGHARHRRRRRSGQRANPTALVKVILETRTLIG